MSTPEPPHNEQAERSVIGSMLINQQIIPTIMTQLDATDFYRGSTTAIYRAITELHRQRVPADLTTVADQLTRMGLYETAGGHSGLTELLLAPHESIYAEHYAGIVARTAAKRRAIDAGLELVRAGYDDATDVADDLARTRKRLAGIVRTGSGGRTVHIRDAVGELAYEIEMRWNGDFEDDVLPTGFSDLDRVIDGGFERGQLVILGGRPGMAKTSWALQVILNYARHQRAINQTPDHSIFFSSEMTLKAILWRALAESSGVPSRQIKHGRDADGRRLSDETKQHIREQLTEMMSLPILINDTSSPTTMTMREEIEQKMDEHPIRFMVFDYLEQAGDEKGKGETQEARIADVAAQLKRIAKQLDITVLALSQLNRAVEGREEKVPTIADLRQSGRIEQEADIILLLYRQDYYTAQNMLKGDQIDPTKAGTADVILAKQRDGNTGTFTLQFVPELTAFRNLDRRDS
jgi:replicative DNA helicase